MRDIWDTVLVHQMRELCESHAAQYKGIIFGIGCALGIRLLFSSSPVLRSSEGDDRCTRQLFVIRASRIVRINTTSKCGFSSKMQMPVLHVINVPKHPLDTYHLLITRVLIVPPDSSDGKCDIGPSGNHCVHKTSNRRLVCGQIAGFFVELPLVNLHRH
jgi:hypothetical protein